MNKTFILVAATALLIAAGLYNVESNEANDVPKHVRMIFAKWQMKHGKVYNGPEENDYRLKVFFKNYLRIKAESLTAVNYKVGLNQFSDLTKKEFLTKYTGLVFNKAQRDEIDLSENIRQGPPTSINWVEKGAVGPIKNQGQCGSCWAFSVVAAVEGMYVIEGNKYTSLSEQQLVDCASSYGPQGCNGGWMDDALRYVKDKGLEKESDYSYTARVQTCKYDASKVVTKIGSIFSIKANDYNALLAGAAMGPITLALDAYGFM